MTFKQLIQAKTWPDISTVFLEIYPEAEKDMEGYKTVFEKLTMMDPEEIDMSIVLENVTDGDELYIDVSALYNNPKNVEEQYSQGIEFTPWRQWLGMDISAESVADFSEAEIIVHCLYEMTFVDFSEEEIQKRLTNIEKRREDFQTLNDEERFVSAASIKELLMEIEEEDENEYL